MRRKAPDKPADKDKPKGEAAEAKDTKIKDVKIDLEGIDQRILSVPMPPRRYTALQVGKAGTLLAIEAAPPGENPRSAHSDGAPL